MVAATKRLVFPGFQRSGSPLNLIRLDLLPWAAPQRDIAARTPFEGKSTTPTVRYLRLMTDVLSPHHLAS
jgi:hypothetical protein